MGCSPRPGDLVAGSGQALLHAPVGIGTAGFGPLGVDAEPSPFSEVFPATTAVHGHPDVKAVYVSRGDDFSALLVRLDMVAVFPGLRDGVLAELQSRLDRDFDDSLVLGATHTHSGPGRVIDGGGPYDLVADRFFPEHYERTVAAIADAAEQAINAAAPAEVAHVLTTSAGHSDRRCEDGADFVDSQLTVLGVRVGGELDSLVLGYAVHGTTVGIDELTLTGDVTGAIEDRVEALFDRPVNVAVFNGWGGDMSPSAPAYTARDGASPIPGDWVTQDAIAGAVAESVEAALVDLPWNDAPAVALRTRRVRIDRQVLGYQGNEFPYPYGATFCGASVESDCDLTTTEDDIIDKCVAFPEEFPAPGVAAITAGTIGDLAVVTFPGEPVTELGTDVVAGLAAEGFSDTFFVGYAQDYTGYALNEADWWQGGYEPNGTMWGPKQGGYLVGEVVETFRRQQSGAKADPTEPARSEAVDVSGYEPYVPESATDSGVVVEPVEAAYGSDGVVRFTVGGQSPWLGTPLFTLLDGSGAIVIQGGRPVDSTGYAMGVSLAVEPSYREERRVDSRAFHWTVEVPVTRPLAGMAPDLRGTYQIRAELGDGTVIDSEPFTAGP